MRTTVAVLLAIPILVVGVTAIGTQADQSESAGLNASDNGSAYNLSSELFGEFTTTAGPGLVFMGIGAVIVGALGVLVAAGAGGRGGR